MNRGSSGGTRSRPRASAVSRSASPLACATHTPPQARITGSIAVTRPLAGVTTWIWPSFQTWLTGSRFETTTSGRSPSRILANCLSRSSVHRVWPIRRSAASSSAAARARWRFLASTVTSRAMGPKRLSSGSSGGSITCPRRTALVQRAILASGWVRLMRTTRRAIRASATASTRKRMALKRHSSHSAVSRSLASRKITSAPAGLSSLRIGSA